jgi:O-methyltransferase
MAFPPFGPDAQDVVASMNEDYVRYAMLALAIHTIREEGVRGSLAEVGVYRGDTSRVIHALAPERTLYLFDTFEGFPMADLTKHDERFRDTSIDLVKEHLGDLNNVVFRKGYFPVTTQGLEDERFALVMLDADLYAPTLAGLEFFYPRLSLGGYLFAHDYNSPESDWGVHRSVTEFFKDKPEKVIEIPDVWGSAVIRKIDC